MEMTTRERWYALHRARRVFLRDTRKHLDDLMTYGSTTFVCDGKGPAAEYVAKAMDMLLNPPHIYDPLLKVNTERLINLRPGAICRSPYV